MDKNEFLWGVASSSHQVERSAPNEWLAESDSIAESNTGASILTHILNRDLLKSDQMRLQILNKDSYSQEADKIEFEQKYETDYELAEEIGVNSSRISVSWAKVEPKKGEFSEQALDHYEEIIEYMRDKGIEPVVTLWHFTHPEWFFDDSGWTNEESVELFGRYVDKVISRLGDKVDIWVTLNEPVGWLRSSYIINKFPPKQTNRRDVIKAFRNMYKSHNSAYQKIKSNMEESQVGISVTSGCFEPYKSNVINKMISKIMRYVERDAFLNRCEDRLDYIGVNNYYHCKVDFLFRNQLSTVPRSDLKWPLSPEGLGKVCEQMYDKYHKPIIVTEHGLADHKDEHRGWYISNSIESLKRKSSQGIPINGYFHWSLTDNIEWNEGRWPRFGLIEIDYETGERKVRDSAEDYRRCIEESSISTNWEEY